MRTLFACLVVSLTIATVAVAQAEPVNLSQAVEGYIYFNRPGATPIGYHSDFGRCVALAESISPSTSGSTPGLVGSIVSGMIADAERSATFQTQIDNCMTVNGWTIMRLGEAQGAALWHADPMAIEQQLDAWVGEDHPPGDVARPAFANDIVKYGSVIDFRFKEFGQSMHSLSLKALDPKTQASLPVSLYYINADAWSKFIVKPLKAADAARVAFANSGDAIVVLTIVEPAVDCRICFVFQRLGSAPTVRAWNEDRRPDIFGDFAYSPTTLVANGAKTYVLKIPPGRWRALRFSGLGLCFGAPAFDVGPGEVVYLGRFDFSAPTMRLDMNVEHAKSELVGLQNISGPIKPATWTNLGATACEILQPNYALQFDNVAFEPGYHLGFGPADTSHPQ